MRTALNCQCGAKTDFEFRKQPPFGVVIKTVECGECGTIWDIKLKNSPSTKNGYQSATRCVEMSQALADKLKAQENKKPARNVLMDAVKRFKEGHDETSSQ